jgi:hypothetical protein
MSLLLACLLDLLMEVFRRSCPASHCDGPGLGSRPHGSCGGQIGTGACSLSVLRLGFPFHSLH